MMFKLTAGNTDARQSFEALRAALIGKIVADKGYLDKALLLRLRRQGLYLISGIRRNIKKRWMPFLNNMLHCEWYAALQKIYH